MPPERYLPIFTSLKVSRIGVISNPARTSSYIKKARKIAAEFGVDLIVREAKSIQDVSGQLSTLTGLVDALWMLPDSITASGEAADAQFLFSAKHRVPVVTFSSAYLDSGAAIAIDMDRFDIGIQGGRMAASIISGGRVSNIPPELPRKITVKTNFAVLRRLNLSPDFTGSRSTK